MITRIRKHWLSLYHNHKYLINYWFVVSNMSVHLQGQNASWSLVNYKYVIVKIRKHKFLFIKRVIYLEPLIRFLFQLHPCLCTVIVHRKGLRTEIKNCGIYQANLSLQITLLYAIFFFRIWPHWWHSVRRERMIIVDWLILGLVGEPRQSVVSQECLNAPVVPVSRNFCWECVPRTEGSATSPPPSLRFTIHPAA